MGRDDRRGLADIAAGDEGSQSDTGPHRLPGAHIGDKVVSAASRGLREVGATSTSRPTRSRSDLDIEVASVFR
jgi:hypothetical protein